MKTFINGYGEEAPLRVLVAVKTCQQDTSLGCNQAIRETWGKNMPEWVDVRFFLGNALGDGPDCVLLPVPDDFDHLPLKARAMLQWTSERQYDFIFFCDTDTYVVPTRWETCQFERHDYSGLFTPGRSIGVKYDDGMVDNKGNIVIPFYAYASTHGCFLSRKAAKLVVNREPSTYYDDVWIGQVLGPYIGEHKEKDPNRITASGITHFDRAIYHMNASTLSDSGRKNPEKWMRWMYQMPEECR